MRRVYQSSAVRPPLPTPLLFSRSPGTHQAATEPNGQPWVRSHDLRVLGPSSSARHDTAPSLRSPILPLTCPRGTGTKDRASVLLVAHRLNLCHAMLTVSPWMRNHCASCPRLSKLYLRQTRFARPLPRDRRRSWFSAVCWHLCFDRHRVLPLEHTSDALLL